MINICGSLNSPVLTKFVRDRKGNFYNIRMREEADKRRKYCESRSNNKSGRPKKKIIRKSHDIHMGNHMEDENEDEDRDINKDKNKKEKKNIYINIFEEIVSKYPAFRRTGKDVALKRFKNTVKNDEDVIKIKRAFSNYTDSKDFKNDFVMRMSKWFNEWTDWLDSKNIYTEGSVEDDERIEASREDYRRRLEAGKEQRTNGTIPGNSEDVRNNDGSAKSAV